MDSTSGARLPLTLAAVGGEYMETATVLEWLVEVGATVHAGQSLVVVETAKAATEIPSPADGVLVRIVAGVGDEVEVGALLGELGVAGNGASTAVPATDTAASAVGLQQPFALEPATPADLPPPAKTPGELQRRFVSPRARRMATELGIDPGALDGTGPAGRIQARDVAAAVRVATPQSSDRDAKTVHARLADTAGAGRADARTDYRRSMAAHMGRAAAVPQFSVSIDVDGSALMMAREQARAAARAANLNDFIVYTVARTLARNRDLNVQFRDGTAFALEHVNVGIALATTRGLVVPVLHDADTLELESLAARSATLARLAKAGQLAAADVLGASFTVSNLSPFGVSEFRALINPPQAAILAVPAFQSQLALVQGKVVERQSARLSITADHRVLDGTQVARFARRLKNALEGFLLP